MNPAEDYFVVIGILLFTVGTIGFLIGKTQTIRALGVVGAVAGLGIVVVLGGLS